MANKKTNRKNQHFRAELLPSGSYRCRVWDSAAKKQRTFIADTDIEAIQMAREWKLGHEIKKAAPDTLGDCIEKYIALESNILSPATVDGYRRIKNRLDPALLDKSVQRITAEDLQAEVNRLSGKYAPKTVKTSFGLVASVMHKYAPRTDTAVTLPQVQKRQRELAPPQVIIDTFKGTDMELVVLLAMWLGLRMSEIRGLKKSDFRDGHVHIDRVIVTVRGEDGSSQHVEKNAAKTTESKRSIKVPPPVQALVDALPDGYITTRTGVKLSQSFKRLISRAGYPGMTFHDLRHVNASVMLMLGVPDKYAMERGGWSTSAVMKRIYQETYSSERERVDTLIDDFFGRIYGC